MQRVLAALAADAGEPDAPERRAQVAQVPGVDPGHAHAHLLGDPVTPLRFWVHTAAARPYGVSFASRTASSSVSNGMSAATGPKTSSRTTRAVLSRPAHMVGSIHAPPERSSPRSGTPPPTSTSAPSSGRARVGLDLVAVRQRDQRVRWSSRVLGPPSRRAPACATSPAANSSKTARCDVHPLGAQAHLAGVGEDRTGQPVHRRSRSASANTRAAFLPPSSNETGFTVGATARMIAEPVPDSPVNVTPSTPGWVVRNSPADPARSRERR